MTNKKAELNITYVVGGVIAAFVLVLALFLVFSPGSSFTKYFSWLPSFNKTIEPVKSIEYIRYDLSNQKISYYDGTTWIPFDKDQVILGEKTIQYSSALEDFQNYYLSERLQKTILIDYRLNDFLNLIIDDKGNRLHTTTISELVKKSSLETGVQSSELKINAQIGKEDISIGGNTIINLIESSTSKVLTKFYLILKSDDSLEFNYVQVDLVGGEYWVKTKLDYSKSDTLMNIVNEAKDFRDSVFKKPIKIRFNQESANYCTQFRDKRFIEVNLAEPTTNTQC